MQNRARGPDVSSPPTLPPTRPPRTSSTTEIDDRALLDFIETRDAECPACGYNVRGLKTPICPECSGRLYLSVGSDNVALGPWVLALVSFALAAGFDGVISIVMSIALIFFGPPSGPNRSQALTMLAAFAVGAAVCGVGIWWLVTRKQRVWNRMERSRQWWAAAAIFMLVGGAHALFGLRVAGVL